MKIFDHFQNINLTMDQHNVLERFHTFLESDERIFIHQVYFGSGKITLLKVLVIIELLADVHGEFIEFVSWVLTQISWTQHLMILSKRKK